MWVTPDSHDALERAASRVRFLGTPVDSVRARELLERIAAMATDGRSHLVCYVNAECGNQAVSDRRYRAILEEADLVYADGMGVVWASRLFGEPLPERLTLGDFLPDLCRFCVERGYRVFFLGGRPGVAKRAASRLKQQVPDLQVVGARHGHFSEEETEAVLEHIRQAAPHILLVGMGVPKQEKWMWRYRNELRVPLLWGVGALFDYYAGTFPRAPVWMRRAGLEWSFRLMREPKRLWRRYLIGNTFFVFRTAALLLVDAALVTVMWLGMYGVRSRLNETVGLAINMVDPYLRMVPAIVSIWLVASAACGAYRRSPTMSWWAELGQVARATGVGLLVTMAVAFLFKEFDLGRSVILPFGTGMLFALTGSRLVARWVERALMTQGIGLRRTLIVGTGALAKRLKAEIEAWPAGYDVVGFVADREAPQGVAPTDVLGSVGDLSRLIQAHEIQDVFVSSQGLKLHEKLNLLAGEQPHPVNFHIVAEELEPFAHRVRLERAAALPLLHLPDAKTNEWYEVSKRLFDLVAAVIGLLATAPVMGAIALAIRLESRGPAIFSQLRAGRHGRLFRMYKFRTMRVGTPVYAVSPNDVTDPRVTRLGRILRRWSLDELPQLLNVLAGDMSLVGPRPEMLFLVNRYEPWQRQRLSVKPGLAGLWQVVGRKELPLHGNLEYDLYYLRHRGWWWDTLILLRTIPAVLSRRGAF